VQGKTEEGPWPRQASVTLGTGREEGKQTPSRGTVYWAAHIIRMESEVRTLGGQNPGYFVAANLAEAN